MTLRQQLHRGLASILLYASMLITIRVYAENTVLARFRNTFDGYLKNATAVRLEKPDYFTQVYNCLQLEYSDWLGDNMGFSLIGRAVYDGAYDLENDRLPDDKDDYGAYADLREALVKLTLGAVDVSAGKQQVVWGKTDGFRVTDVVNPLDYRNPTVVKFLDSRIPLWMLNLEYYPSLDHMIQILAIPDMRFAEIPRQPTPSGVSMQADQTPKVSLRNTEYGIRYSGYLNGWDITLNYLYSWNDIPYIRRKISSDGMISLTPEHIRLHIAGGTFATVLWEGVIRGEFAAQPDFRFSVTDPVDPDGLVEKTLLAYALAYERDLFDLHWLVQFFQQRIADYEAEIDTEESLSYFTLNSSKTFLRETLELSASAVYEAANGSWLLHPEVTYDYSDTVKFTGGVEFSINDAESNENRDAERLHAGITYSF